MISPIPDSAFTQNPQIWRVEDLIARNAELIAAIGHIKDVACANKKGGMNFIKTICNNALRIGNEY